MGKKLDIAVALKIGADVSASVAKSFGETKSHLDKLTRAAALAAKEQAAAEAKYDKARQQKRSLESARTTSRRLIGERENAISDVASIEAKRNAVRVDVKKYGSKDDIKRLRSLDRAFDRATRKVDTATTALDKHRQKLAEAGKEAFALAGKTRELEKEVDKLGNAAAKADKKLVSAEGWNKLKFGALAFTSIAVGAVAAVGSVAAATVTALWKIDKSVSDRVENINNTSAGAGVSPKTLQTFRRMAFLGGNINADTADRILQNFLDNSQKAMTDPKGGKKYADAMLGLGMNPNSLRGKTRNEGTLAFVDMLERNKDNPNASVHLRTLLSARLGQKAKAITGGRGEFHKTYEEGLKSGDIISDKDRDKAKEFDDALDSIELKIQGIKNIIAGETFKPFADALNTAADTIAKHAPEIKEFAKTFGKTIEDFVNSGALTRAIEEMGRVFGLGLKLTGQILGGAAAEKAVNDATSEAEFQRNNAENRYQAAKREADKLKGIPQDQLTPQQKLIQAKLEEAEVQKNISNLTYKKSRVNSDWVFSKLRQIPGIAPSMNKLADWSDDRRSVEIENLTKKLLLAQETRRGLGEMIARGGGTINNSPTIINNNYITTTADPNATGQAVADASRKTLNDLHYDSKP